MPKRIRHCKCAHMPDRESLIAALQGRVGLSVRASNRLADALLERFPTSDHRHDRSLDYVSLPDAFGHQYWTGPLPLAGGSPRVMRDGVRLPVAQWLWEREGRPAGIPLVRTCHDPKCICPAHHALEPSPAHMPITSAQVYAADLADFDRMYPRINFKPKKWNRSDPRGEHCLRGHPLKVYGEPKLRQAYCAQCAVLERDRLKRRAQLVRDLDRRLQMLVGAPVDYADYAHPTDGTLPDVSEPAPSPEPSLAERILQEYDRVQP